MSKKRRLDTVIASHVKGVLLGMDTVMPAKVVSYDATTRRAVVQPVFKLKLNDGSLVSRAPVSDVPVLALGGAGAVIEVSVAENDDVLLLTAQRDLSEFKKSNSESSPGDAMFNLKDAVALPVSFAGSSQSPNAVVVRRTDGDASLTVESHSITLRAGGATLVLDEDGLALNGNALS